MYVFSESIRYDIESYTKNTPFSNAIRVEVHQTRWLVFYRRLGNLPKAYLKGDPGKRPLGKLGHRPVGKLGYRPLGKLGHPIR